MPSAEVPLEAAAVALVVAVAVEVAVAEAAAVVGVAMLAICLVTIRTEQVLQAKDFLRHRFLQDIMLPKASEFDSLDQI